MSYEKRLFVTTLIPWERGYEVHVYELYLEDPTARAAHVGVTQVVEPGEAEEMARDYLSLLLRLPRRAFDVVALVPESLPLT